MWREKGESAVTDDNVKKKKNNKQNWFAYRNLEEQRKPSIFIST